jgi:anionic cell wall polymer biosynthesis LytR-Cps2A-Psr (LCP) family protein
VAKQTLTASNLTKVDDFVKIFRAYVETDLTLGNLAWLGKEAISMGADSISFSTLSTNWVSPYIHPDPEETLTLVNQFLNPFVEDRVPEDLNLPQ